MSHKETLLTYEEAHRLWNYDPDSGVFVWRVSRGTRVKAGCIAGGVEPTKGYIRIETRDQWYSAHRLAWIMTYGSWPEGFIDHINGVPADNRIENLREASRHINGQNQRLPSVNNTTGFLGVSKRSASYRKGPYTAQIRDPIAKKIIFLGFFHTAEEAHAAYVAKKRELHPGCTI